MNLVFSDRKEVLPKQIRYFTHRLRMGICMSITGSPFQKCGCGKSLTAIGIGSMLDPNFSMKKVALSPGEFLQGIDEFNKNLNCHKKPEPGQVVVLDEGEISAPSSLWFSFTNRAIFYSLATFRHLNGVAIICTPSLKWIDSRMRTLMTFWGYTNKEIDSMHGDIVSVKMKLYRVSTDLFGEQFFFSKIKAYDRVNKRLCIFKEFDVKLPDPEIVAEYEEKSNIQKTALRKDLMKDVLKFEKLSSYSETADAVNLETLAQKVIDNPDLRNTLFAGKGLSASLLRVAMEREGHNLKLGEAELLKKIILRMYNPTRFNDL